VAAGENDHLRAVVAGEEPELGGRSRLEFTQDHVGPKARQQPSRVVRIGGPADDLEPFVLLERRGQRLAEERLWIHHKDANKH